MKHITKIFIFILAVLLFGGILVSCTYDEEWLYNSYVHWQVGEDGETLNQGNHSGGEATYERGPVCDVCCIEYGEHLHEGQGAWEISSAAHWKNCSCGKKTDMELHIFIDGSTDDKIICEICGFESSKHVHYTENDWNTNASEHWKTCSCGEVFSKGKHSGGEGQDGTAVCTVCNRKYTPVGGSSSHVHTSVSGWYSNYEQHWLWCTCGEQYGFEAHYGGIATVDDYAVCVACGQEYGELLSLDLPGLIQGYHYGGNAFAYIISCDSDKIDGSVSGIINRKIDDMVDDYYLPLYWVYYLRELGYSHTETVVENQKQRIHFILDGDVFYAQAYYDVQYTAYDKDGNVIEFSEEHGKNPVGDMLKEKFSDIYDVRTGRVVTENSLIMDGSTSTIPLEVAFRMGYYGETGGVASQKVIHNTTYGSFYNLRDGICDLIFTTPLSAQQRDEAKNRGLDLAEVPICMEAFVFVVNANNPVEELTVQQLRDIYSGKITNWKEVGGPDASIEAFQRNVTSGSQNYMKFFMGDTPLMDPITYITPSSMEGLVEVLASYDNAVNSIGYSVYSYAANMYVDAGKIKFIKVNGIAPTEETMGDLSYPLLNYNYAVYDKYNGNPEIEKMVNWILSDEGQKAVAEGGYVPLQGGNLPNRVDTQLDLYDAVGTGRYSSDVSVHGLSAITFYSHSIHAEPPEKYLTESSYLKDQYGEEYPIVYGIKYTVDGFVDETVEAKINDFIATACAEVEEKFEEVCEQFLVAHVNNDRYVRLADEWTMEGFSTPIVRPSKVEIRGQNGYLSVIVHSGFSTTVNDDDIYYRYYTKTATFDLRTGNRIERLSDLFPEGVEFVDKLNDSILYSIDEISGDIFGSAYNIDGEFLALTEADVENFTCNSVIFPFGSSAASWGLEVEFSVESLVSEYCDMHQFFTEEFKGRFWGSTTVTQSLGTEKSVSIGGSSLAGVYYPSDADSALIKAAKYLAEYVEQFVSEDIALKMYHDAGHTNVVRVEYAFPKFLPKKVGDLFYCFSQREDVWENIYYAYDADGNRVFDEKLMVGYSELQDIDKTFYFHQSTGEPVIVKLKDGWEEDAIVYSQTDGQEWTYQELADIITVIPEDLNFFTGRYFTRVKINDKWHSVYVNIPLSYIVLE